MRWISGALWMAIAACAASAPQAGPAARPDEGIVDAGPLRVKIHISRTAHLFHVVDQLSAWSEFCHRQYERHFQESGGLSDRDRALLAEHASLRKERGWGQGLEQTFYTPLELEDAFKAGVEARHVTPEQVDVARRVLTHFAPRIEQLMKDEAKTLEAFRDRIPTERDRLAAFSAKVSRLCRGVKVDVPVYLIANPDAQHWGGGFNGGRLTMEIPRGSDVMPTFQHELLHAFLDTVRPELDKAVRGVPGLDVTTLNEGLAYALSPGLFNAGKGTEDPLRDLVMADLRAKRTLDQSYPRFHRFGLALRPLVREALESDSMTIDTLLPRAVDVWRAVRELSGAIDARPRRMFSLGPGWEVLQARTNALGIRNSSYNHAKDAYQTIISDARPSDPVYLLIALDHKDRAIPEEFRDFLPEEWAKVEAELKAGRTVKKAGQTRGLRTVLLAAPTLKQLEAMIESLEPSDLKGR